MSNSHYYFSYPDESEQSTNYDGHYNLRQVIAAQKTLLQEVSYGRLQWLCSTMRFNPYSGKLMTSNLWEGDEGMMEHIQESFPMPLSTSFLESSVEDHPTGVNSGSDHDRLNEEFIDNNSIFNSWNMEEPFRVSESSDTKRAESVSDKSSSRNNGTDNCAASQEQKLTFLEKITDLNLKLNKAHKRLTSENKRLGNCHLNVRKKICRKLASLCRQSVLYQTMLGDLQNEMESSGYMNPNKICNNGKKFRYKKQGKNSLSSNLNSAIINCDNLRSRLRNILHSEASLIEPYRAVLKYAIKDLSADRHENDQPLPNSLIEK